ncbi:hypothetical protein HDU83_000817 [Entophlyctis luteolus]|nr:hypothetical protein HDU82_001341 [Entophlyctis luteolus]KAJ3349040.1 hypothetical protein HDU83_000817 [Entophlyctis luteolus]
MSTKQPSTTRRSRAQDPKLSTTLNPQVAKRTSAVSPLPPSASPNTNGASAGRRARPINAFWGEDPGRELQNESSKQIDEEESDAKVNVKEWYSKLKDHPESGKSTPKRSVLFETQQIMPAPGTTYYQLKWTRDGALNPGQKVIKTEDFIDDELKTELVYIFGQETYDMAIAAAKASLKQK